MDRGDTNAMGVKPRKGQGLCMPAARDMPKPWAPVLLTANVVFSAFECKRLGLALLVIQKLAILTYSLLLLVLWVQFLQIAEQLCKSDACLQLSLA